MKKVIIGLLVAVVVLVLCLVAFNACDVPIGQASAETVQDSLSLNSSKIVKPNALSYYDLSSCVTTSTVPNTSAVPVSATCTFNISSSGMFTSTSAGYVYLTFENPGDGHSYRFWVLWQYMDGTSNYSVPCQLYNLTSMSNNNFNLSAYGSSTTMTNVNPSYYDIHTSGLVSTLDSTSLMIRLNVPSNFRIYYVKLEDRQFYDGSVNSNFTGFIIPGYTYDEPDLPDQPDEPDLSDFLTYENKLHGSDFYLTPHYETSGINQRYYNIWTTNVPTSELTYNAPLVGELGSLSYVPSTSYTNRNFVYRYYPYYEDRNIPSNIVSKVCFTLCIDTNVAGNIKLTKGNDLLTTVQVDFSADSGQYQLLKVVISNFNEQSVLNISLNLPSVDSNTSINLYFSKLEYFDDFSGYVVPEHDISFYVRDNLIDNYLFQTVPEYVPTSSSDIDKVDTWMSPYNFNYHYDSEGGLVLENNSDATVYFFYHTDLTSFAGDYFTFSFRFYSLDPLRVLYTDHNLNVPGSGSSYFNSYYLSAPSPYTASYTFLADADIYFNLAIQPSQTVTLYACKLEKGENFSGYCPSFSSMYKAGQSDGYNEGFVAGVEVYGNQNIVLAFNNVESPNYINQGWSDWGFADIDAFLSAFGSLTSYFYTDNNYEVLSFGNYALADQSGNVIGRGFWISRDPDATFGNAINYVNLSVYSDHCYITIADTTFPSDWNPVNYPRARVVVLNLTRDLDNLLSEYKESIFENGYTAGKGIGYDLGYNQGKAAGYTLANEVGSNQGWLGFFSAFVDVPIKVLTSLLDFDFFGFNLFNLFKILVLVALFYLVIRLVTKGKVSQ